MVTADERHSFGVADFEGEEEEERLDAVEAAVDKVACRATFSAKTGLTNDRPTHEEIVRFWAWPADLEELHHVPKLAVYVPAYLQPCVISRVRPSTR